MYVSLNLLLTYCYWGLKRREDAEQIATYDAFHRYSGIQSTHRSIESSDVYHLSCQLVCEWASQLLDKPFSDIKSLSEYLISIGFSCGKTAAMFTLMSGSTSPPKLASEKKTLSSRLVQRRLQHNEIIRKHKEKIKQQLKLKRERQEAVTKQRQSPGFPEQIKVLHPTVSSTTGTAILPRPLSVQPYMCNTSMNADNPSHNIWYVSVSPRQTPLQGLQSETMQHILSKAHSVAQTKRCLSTSVVEKHLVVPSSLGPFVSDQLCKVSEKTPDGNHEVWGPSHTPSQLMSASEETSRSPSLSPITTPITSYAARNISRLLESPAPPTLAMSHQNKRNGETISHSEEASVKKRCTTSIGVTKQDSLDMDLEKKEDDLMVVRPYSCPVPIQDPHCLNLKGKKKGTTLVTASLKSKPSDSKSRGKATPQNDRNEKKNDMSQAAESSGEPKSFHFVQKPQVISRTERRLSSRESHCSSQIEESPGRTRYNILNSLLSSDHDLVPLLQPAPCTVQVPHLRRISGPSHTSESTGFRSAFVPVTSQKQLTYATDMEESKAQNIQSDGEYVGPSERIHLTVQSKDSDKSVGAVPTSQQTKEKTDINTDMKTKLKQKGSNTQFACATSSSSSSSSSSTLCQSGDSVLSFVDSTFATPTPTTISEAACVQKNPALVTASAPATLSKVPSGLALSQSTAHGSESKCIVSGSPSFTAKKGVKNRFTPIRPKLDGCFNVSPPKMRPASTSASPQKRDMRPVHTLLQEHRIKNAQDLLANLANNCQAASGNILFSLGSTKSEGLPQSIPLVPATLNVRSSLPLPQPVHTENQRVGKSTFDSVCQPQISPATSLVAVQKESRLVVLPTSPHKQPDCGRKPILMQDEKGNKYNIDEQPSKSLLLQSNLQAIGPSRKAQVASAPNFLNRSSAQVHMVGPDAHGQTYLLVPNSDTGVIQSQAKPCLAAAVSPVRAKATLAPQDSASSSSDMLEWASKPDTLSGQKEHAVSTVCTEQPNLSKDVTDTAAPEEIEKRNNNSDTGAGNQQQESNIIESKTAVESRVMDLIELHPGHETGPETGEILETQLNSSLLTQQEQFLVPQDSTEVSAPGVVENNNISISNICAVSDISERSDADVNEVLLPHQIVRKRKAASGASTECEGKKRTGSYLDSNQLAENMENVEPPDLQEAEDNNYEVCKSSETIDRLEGRESSTGIGSIKAAPLSHSTSNLTDTETLLSMIGDTKSMTVKEVVSALNKLRAELRSDHGQKTKLAVSAERETEAKTTSLEEIKRCTKSTEAVKAKTSTALPPCESSPGSEVVSQQQRPSRRNVSLNLESLEIDALLDMEPSLDSKLVVDIRDRAMGQAGQSGQAEQQTGRRASIGSASKGMSETKPTYKTLRKQNRSKSFKQSGPTCVLSEKRPASVSVMDIRDKGNKQQNVLSNCPPQQPGKKAVERSKSCVQDILDRGISCKRNEVMHQFSSIVGRFSNTNVKCKPSLSSDGKVSVPYQNNGHSVGEKAAFRKAHDDTKTKTVSDTDLPVDIIEFITESMSVGTSYHSSPFNPSPVSSWLAELAGSTPQTKPVDEGRSLHTVKKVRGLQSCITRSNLSSEPLSHEENDFERQADIFSSKAASTACTQGTSISDGTFLSPTGPARSARRPSMERVMYNERITTRTPVDQRPPSSRLKVRTDTPVESLGTTASDTAIVNKQLGDKKECLSARDHTTSVMLQQPFTQRGNGQSAVDFSLETCMTSFVRQGSAELCRADRALSETPVSDPGYSSVGQTPVSEVGCSSISPSPVMMSVDSTFRPVQSDAEGNQAISETCADQTDGELNDSVMCERQKSLKVSSGSNSQPECKRDPGSGSGKDRTLSDTLCALTDLDHLMSVRLQCIPTPPTSPSGSPQPRKETFSSPMPFEQKQKGKPNTEASSFIAPLGPPSSLSGSAMSSGMYRLNITTNSPGIMTHSDFTSPGIISRFSPSPNLCMRPSCSPYHHYPHPSPPFTPSSQRCPTPSTLAMVSPRSNTPCGDASTAPNRFMPIQTSGILATSMTITQTYIQPIKPVVTLASATSQKAVSNCGPVLSGYVPRLPLPSSTPQQYSSSSLDMAKSCQNLALPLQTNSSLPYQRNTLKKAHQSCENKIAPWPANSAPLMTSTDSSYSEKTGQPALVLSLSGSIGSVSLAGQGLRGGHSKLFSNQSLQEQVIALPSYREAVSQTAVVTENSPTSTAANRSKFHRVQGGLQFRKTAKSAVNADALFPSEKQNLEGVGDLGSEEVMPASVYKEDCGSPVLELMPESISNVNRDPQVLMPALRPGFTDQTHGLGMSTTAEISEDCRSMEPGIYRVPAAESSYRSVSLKKEVTQMGSDMNLCVPAYSPSHTHDDLAETLDVLKSLDSQYFQHDDDSNSSTSL
ncbi:DNA-binding protein rfx7 [Plakobranchus ocellatus]|uniref:DNA-binding protein rfx7 n=1 Tax=Plakobranchus ocellatus TaxID=259542 RepID=A0AAV4CU77_9GAST|nr:DNA-binding protein rfx7 [Plakobranchus ocellatus]